MVLRLQNRTYVTTVLLHALYRRSWVDMEHKSVVINDCGHVKYLCVCVCVCACVLRGIPCNIAEGCAVL